MREAISSSRGPVNTERSGIFRYGHLFTALIMMCIIMAGGTFGYHYIEKEMDLFDSFYMTVITVTTVGFGEIDGISEHSRPLTIILIFSGFGLISYSLFAISQMVIEGEIQRMLGRRKLDKKVASLKNHVIICGYGRIGQVIADFMKQYKEPYVVVDINGECEQQIRDAGHLVVIGDATTDAVLEKAGIGKASKLVATTHLDAQNVFIVLTAREMNNKLVIHSRVNNEETESRLIRAGADKVIFPDKIGGYRMAMGMVRPNFTHFMDVISRSYEEGEVALDEVEISEGSKMDGVTLMESKIRQDYNLIVIAIRDEQESFHFNPDKDTTIKAGDTVIALGLRRDLSKFETNMTN
jgi:voltage-gated potassium channel